MQEKIQNISPIKQRILQFIGSLGISKREFYSSTAISRGTLESNSGITEEIIARFIATYQNVSPAWLLTGEGTMLRVSDASGRASATAQAVLPAGPCQQCELRDMIIAQQAKTIALLEDKITGTTGKPKPTLTHDDIR